MEIRARNLDCLLTGVSLAGQDDCVFFFLIDLFLSQTLSGLSIGY